MDNDTFNNILSRALQPTHQSDAASILSRPSLLESTREVNRTNVHCVTIVSVNLAACRNKLHVHSNRRPYECRSLLWEAV